MICPRRAQDQRGHCFKVQLWTYNGHFCKIFMWPARTSGYTVFQFCVEKDSFGGMGNQSFVFLKCKQYNYTWKRLHIPSQESPYIRNWKSVYRFIYQHVQKRVVVQSCPEKTLIKTIIVSYNGAPLHITMLLQHTTALLCHIITLICHITAFSGIYPHSSILNITALLGYPYIMKVPT